MLSRAVAVVNRRCSTGVLRWALLTIGTRASARFPLRGSDSSALGGWLLPVGDRRGIGERLGVQIHFFPLFIIVAKIEFVLEFGCYPVNAWEWIQL
jgi:hypothetical protein